MRPEDVTVENVDEARAQLVTELKGLLTAARRNEEVLTAVAQLTGDASMLKQAQAVTREVSRLDTLVAELLKDGS